MQSFILHSPSPPALPGFSLERIEAALATSAPLGVQALMAGHLHKKAAVLILLFPSPQGEISVLLTGRSRHLAYHPGEVCFPGGRFEVSDASMAAAALREAGEEIGVAPEGVRVLGNLPTFVTRRTHYLTTPVVGFVPELPTLVLNPREVDYAFAVPMHTLLNPLSHRYRLLTLPSGEYVFNYTAGLQSWNIWGATAHIVRLLYWQLSSQVEGGTVLERWGATATCD